MLKRFILLFAVLTCTIPVHAQEYMDWGASISIDPASGEITGYGFTFVENGTSAATATVNDCLYNGCLAPTDNCGAGCAQVYNYAQVDALGKTFYNNTGNYASDTFPDGSTWSDNETASAWQYVPPSPTIHLNDIDARDPHNVYWYYSVDGACPYSLNWALAQYLQIATGCPGQFIVDQSSYPWGLNTAEITGHMFGFTTPGPNCNVNFLDNISTNDYAYGVSPDGTGEEYAPQYIQVKHIIALVEHYIDYNSCGAYLNNTDNPLVAKILRSLGTISTEESDPASNRVIYGIGETFNNPFDSEPLGPGSQNDNYLVSRENDYADWWWPVQQQPFSICNTLLLFLEHPDDSSPSIPGTPQGCIYKNSY